MIEVRPPYLGIITILLTLLNITCVILPYWMSVDDEIEIGVFDTLGTDTDKNKFLLTRCYETYSETQCGFLRSAQVASIITILFGFFASIFYFLPPRHMSTLPSFVAISGTMGHFIFALLTTLYFHFFKADYIDDDGINREDDDGGTDYLNWSYWIWVGTTVVSFCVVAFGYPYIYKLRAEQKPLL
eukprot:gene8409-9268_t